MPSDVIFVTGASGFIGGHVVREALAAGYKVRALVRRETHADGLRGQCEIIRGDLRRAGELTRALSGCRYLIHCAAVYSFAPGARSAIDAVNVAGTAGLLEAARIAAVERAVVTSSAATVGPARNGTLASEENVAQPRDQSAYHRSKVSQERVALAARVPVVLLLPTAPVGPGDWKPTPTGRLVLDFARGRIPARAPGNGGLNMVPVEDVARAHVSALNHGVPGQRYIVGGDNLSFDQVWDLLADVTKRPAPKLRLPYELLFAAAVIDQMRCTVQPGGIPVVPLEGVQMARERMFVDCSKAKKELGYQCGPVRDALARSVAWYRAHGYVS